MLSSSILPDMLTRSVLIILVLFIGACAKSRSCHTSKLWDNFPASQPHSGSDERSIPDDDVVAYHYILSDDTTLENAISSDGDVVEEVRVDNGRLRAYMRSASNSGGPECGIRGESCIGSHECGTSDLRRPIQTEIMTRTVRRAEFIKERPD
jgi:hypothetical protein